MAKADYRDVVLVTGTDPYGWKGIEDLARPFVRPDRSGGRTARAAATGRRLRPVGGCDR